MVIEIVLLAAVPLAISTIVVLNRRRIVERQRRVALRKFGRMGPRLADGMTTSQVVVAAVAISVLGAINVVGVILRG